MTYYTPPDGELRGRRSKNPATLAQMRDSVMAAARAIGKQFREPDDDWIHAMLVQNKDGVRGMTLPNEAFASGATKDLLGEALRRAMREWGVFRYALVLNTHGIDTDAISEEQLERVRREEVRIEQLPGAVEQLTLTVGDAESEEYWIARINRDARRPPTLKRWERMDTTTGRFAGLNEYLRLPRGVA